MNAAHHHVGGRGDDAEGPYPFAGDRRFPILPQSPERERRAIPHRDRIGSPGAPGRLPFEEAVDRDEAAPPGIGVPKGRKPCHGLRLGIDRLAAPGGILAAVWDEAPTQRIERPLPRLMIFPNDQ